jgi:hypothetical protein
LPEEEKKLSFRLFRKRHSEEESPKNNHFPGLKNKLNQLKSQKTELNEILLKKQPVKRAGEKWKKLLDRCLQIDVHLKELSLKLEENDSSYATY